MQERSTFKHLHNALLYLISNNKVLFRDAVSEYSSSNKAK